MAYGALNRGWSHRLVGPSACGLHPCCSGAACHLVVVAVLTTTWSTFAIAPVPLSGKIVLGTVRF